ncbi:Hsp20 family protein [Microbulbifer sp. Q7]|uniref:Hsp20 family protein n=1 Tax=Microbulbifer sp. Q7 TaxID=1785091 RepID=UPI0008302DF6|nr:Hsp20 family protein [Microbulbifer sp. Q7]
MRNLDLSPLYRSAIGFDRLASLLDTMTTSEQNQPAYPPYNIELTGEDAYRISMAVAGFDQSELDIQMEQNRLTVSGKKVADEEKRNFLHRGIAARNFERRFQLADHVRVTDAQLVNGLLHIELVREIPEAMKPRKIEISSGNLLQSTQADEPQAGERGSGQKSVPVGEQAA